ncbi:MAG TPA: hypothetical protein VM694_38460 [Polyangium sp.]|jgi:hypothetical protein|nr:hypothetical protein [Polyangium sp.]
MQTNDETTTEIPETTPPEEDTDDGPETPRIQVLAAPAEEVGEPDELPTEYAIGSDGRLYVTEDGFKPGATEDRKQFIGFQLTAEEAGEVWDKIHRQAFNATQTLRAGR